MSHLDRMKAFAPRSNASVGVMGSANPSDFALLLAAPAARSRRGTYSERSADKQRSFEAERLAAQQGLGGLVYERDLGGRSTRDGRAGRYDRLSDGVGRVTGRPAMSVREFVALHAGEFGGRRP